MIHFFIARYEMELAYAGSREDARRTLAGDAGEEGYFENYYENGDRFRLFLKRKFPFTLLIAVPEGYGTWEEGKVRLTFQVSKMSRAVEWILYGSAALMCVILAAAGKMAGIPLLWKAAAFFALLLVLRHGLRTAGFWMETIPAVRRIKRLWEPSPFGEDRAF